MIEVDLTGPFHINGVLITALAGLGRTTLFIVKIYRDAVVVAIHTLGRPDELSDDVSTHVRGGINLPSKLVSIPDPEVLGLAQSGLDALGVPDLLEQGALGIVGRRLT